MFTSMIVVAVTPFSGTTTPDKNGQGPVMLQCIAGVMPNRNVLSGTVAERAGLEVGKSYLVQVREAGFDELFGPDFQFIKVSELTSGLDIVKAVKEIGDPTIQVIERPEGYTEKYQRKGDAVEGQRTERIKAGLYRPAYGTTVLNHKTARKVLLGISVVNEDGTTDREPAAEKQREQLQHQEERRQR